MFSKIKNQSLKCLSILLSVTTLFSAGFPHAFAQKTEEQKPNNFASLVKKGKEFCKNNSDLCGALLVAGVVGTYKAVNYAKREWNLRSVTTAIDNLSDNEVDDHVLGEVSAFISRAPDVFKVDYELVQKSDHRFLLLTLMRINYLFDKYEGFTKDLIDFKRSMPKDKRNFTLWPYNFKNYAVEYNPWRLPTAAAGKDLSGIGFTLDNYRNILHSIKRSVKNGYHSPCETNQLLESVVTHEFGHAIESLYESRIKKLNWADLPSAHDIVSTHRYKKKYDPYILQSINNNIRQMEEKEEEIKEDIIHDCEEEEISYYGSTAPCEFFAEAFAHLECCDAENVNEIGRSTENYLVNVMHYLPKERSKFNQ